MTKLRPNEAAMKTFLNMLVLQFSIARSEGIRRLCEAAGTDFSKVCTLRKEEISAALL